MRKLGRLGRSVKNVLIIADSLHERGIGLKILTGRLAGLAAARAKGRAGGRPTVMDPGKLAAARARNANGQSPAQIAKALGVSRAAIYRYLSPGASVPGGAAGGHRRRDERYPVAGKPY